MKRIIQTSFFKVLSLKGLTAYELRAATDKLVDGIIALGGTEYNPTLHFRTLQYTRYHLQIIKAKTDLAIEMGEKCIRTALCH
ncbi:hypothetical protein [Prevotella disiens]|uniref:Uncharacterized protein n=1 Tax=Prevotella disiens DNF00882 TaxID=1401075 RepID=A0A096ARC3_9BACT|nr:hypothetical protein [Prevotella disiens]KGF49648.1 hypothetical protein HMPREF0654_04435 [Prevotella disiens DNF00882]